MKRILFGAAVAWGLGLALPAAAQDLASQIVGMWKYTGLTTTEIATGKVNKPFGDKPNGYIVYTKSGRMLWSLVAENRSKPAGAAVTDSEAVALFKTLSAGSGTYKVEGALMSQAFDSSWNQAWTGTSVKRKIEIAGNKLIITSDPIKTPGTGLDVTIQSILERVE